MPASAPLGPHRPLVLWGCFPRPRRACGWRWAWAVDVWWPDPSSRNGRSWDAAGIAQTEPDAVASARQAIETFWSGAEVAGGGMAKFAREVFSRQARRARWARGPGERTDAAPLAFVWRNGACPDTGWPCHGDHGVPHLVVGRTSRWVVVEREPFWFTHREGMSPEEEFLEHGRRTVRLNRAALEHEGWTWSAALRAIVSRDPPEPHGLAVGSGLVQEASALLGLPWPTTRSEVVRAYRRRARETHPDRGGAPEAFRQVHAAFSLLRAVLPRLQPDDPSRGAR